MTGNLLDSAYEFAYGYLELTEEGPCCVCAYDLKKQSKWQNRHNNLHYYSVYDEQMVFPCLISVSASNYLKRWAIWHYYPNALYILAKILSF